MTVDSEYSHYDHSLFHHYYQQRTQGSYADHEPSLWRAVITQALMDAASKSPKQEARRTRETVRDWLLTNTSDFEVVCDHAGFDPGYVRRRAREALGRGCEWRLPSGQGWRTQLRQAQQRAASMPSASVTLH
jgi:hypothetical protein